MKPIDDAFTTHFFRRLDSKIKNGLTPEQRDAITDALRQSAPREHSVDLRGTINLVFARFYVVFLAGRDLRRKQTEASNRARSDARKLAYSLFLLAAYLVPVISVIVVLLYGVKCLLGINIFENKHLMDFLR